jgi:hypothetical protein
MPSRYWGADLLSHHHPNRALERTPIQKKVITTNSMKYSAFRKLEGFSYPDSAIFD